MVYIDAFGDVSPCVFTPMTFGNIQETNLIDLVRDMRSKFPSEDSCFINKNYKLIQEYSHGQKVLSRQATMTMMNEVRFGPAARFFELYYGKNERM
jgi:MoaA/NifB/PqqE/SkfB family radical SAM enzyme